MEIRAARVEDAPAMGRLMVEAWLSAHRGQVPDALWELRRAEWTPEVSARAWERNLRERHSLDPAAIALADVILLAVDRDDTLTGLVLGTAADDDTSGRTAEIGALYVDPQRRGEGIGRLMLRAAAAGLADQGFSTLHIAVLAANLPARGFYEAMGGRDVGEREFDEDGAHLLERVYEWPDIAVLLDCSS